MGRPPGNGGPAFRFTPSEVSQMESILQEHDNKIPPRDQFVALAEKFSNGSEREGISTMQMKQVMNWFQNKRYALKAKSSKVTQKLDIAPMQAVLPLPPGQASVLKHIPHVHQEVNGGQAFQVPRSFAPHSGKALNSVEFEARSARDGAWYDVAAFLSVRNKDTDDPIRKACTSYIYGGYGTLAGVDEIEKKLCIEKCHPRIVLEGLQFREPYLQGNSELRTSG